MTAAPDEVVLIGAYPPPIGGNSVHVRRLEQLLAARSVAVRVVDCFAGGPAREVDGVLRVGGVGALVALWKLSRGLAPGAVVHVHISGSGRFKWIAPFLLATFRRQAKVLTIHSGSFIRIVTESGSAKYLRPLLARFEHVVCVSEQIAAFLLSEGLPSERLSVVPAFLAEPRAAGSEAPVRRETDPTRIRVTTSGYLTRIYDYAPLIRCAELLDPTRYEFCFAFYNETDPAYEAEIVGRLARCANVVVYRDLVPSAFLELLRESDVYARTTLTDGDSVAVREALAIGLRVLATDAVARPAGCELFPSGDSDALRALLATDRPAAPRAPEGEAERNFERVLDAYRRAQLARGRTGGAG